MTEYMGKSKQARSKSGVHKWGWDIRGSVAYDINIMHGV